MSDDRDMNLEVGLTMMYAAEITGVAYVLKGKNLGEVRRIFVEVTFASNTPGATNLTDATREVLQILETVGERHVQFVLGAAVLRNRKA
jgi:hypothetical protein